MFCPIKSIHFLILIFVGLVLGGEDSCRQCQGTQSIAFDTYTSPAAAEQFFRFSIGYCATGEDYWIDLVEKKDCTIQYTKGSTLGSFVCLNYVFHIRVWRYCGNGGTVELPKFDHCQGKLCASTDNLNMKCHKSVHCRSDCNCDACGCNITF